MRYNFNEVFRIKYNGEITPIRLIRLGGVRLGSGVNFSKGGSISGVNIFNYLGDDIEAEEIEGILIIQGFYQEVKNNG